MSIYVTMSVFFWAVPTGWRTWLHDQAGPASKWTSITEEFNGVELESSCCSCPDRPDLTQGRRPPSSGLGKFQRVSSTIPRNPKGHTWHRSTGAMSWNAVFTMCLNGLGLSRPAVGSLFNLFFYVLWFTSTFTERLHASEHPTTAGALAMRFGIPEVNDLILLVVFPQWRHFAAQPLSSWLWEQFGPWTTGKAVGKWHGSEIITKVRKSRQGLEFNCTWFKSARMLTVDSSNP